MRFIENLKNSLNGHTRNDYRYVAGKVGYLIFIFMGLFGYAIFQEDATQANTSPLLAFFAFSFGFLISVAWPSLIFAAAIPGNKVLWRKWIIAIIGLALFWFILIGLVIFGLNRDAGWVGSLVEFINEATKLIIEE